MKLRSPLLFALMLGTAFMGPAHAASSAWTQAEGGRVRLVTSGPVGADGALRGALQIELEPGWKTYWRDPGATGVPPQFDLSKGGDWTDATLEFPAPEWHEDDYGRWAGYDRSVALPVTLQAAQGASPAEIKGAVFLGICQTICVPLQADISLKVDQFATPLEDSSVVQAAWDALPKPATPQLGIAGTNMDDAGALIVHVASPSLPVDLFVAGEHGYVVAPPKRKGDRDFVVKIIAYPKGASEGPGLRYTLRTPDGAVSGFIPHPGQ